MKNKGKMIAVTLFAAMIMGTAAACDTKDQTPPEETLPDQSTETSVPDSVPESPATPPQEEATPVPRTVRYIRVKTDGLNVRTKASASSASLGTVDTGVGMLYLGEENGFYKTFYRNRTAYISAKSSYSEIYDMPYSFDAAEEVIREGCKVIGTPYVYGAVRYHDGNGNVYKGFSVTKFDCSSLTQYIFFKGSNTLLQVNTRTQISQGKHVDRKNLQRGDLIFFTNDSRRYNTGIERVGHVAMYLGDNLILHTASDYCKIEPISAKRWSYYIEARRMVEP